MAANAIVVQGTLQPDGTLMLDEKPSLPPGRVRVQLEQVASVPKPEAGIIEVLEQIKCNQAARGFKGRTKEEIDADVAALRAEEEEYEDRWRQIWRPTASHPQEPSP